MNVKRSDIATTVDRSTVRSVSKLLLVSIWLVFMVYLLTWLPGIDRLVPRTPVTAMALVGAVATVVLVGLLVVIAPKLALLVRVSLEGPRPIIENIASVAYWLVILVAVLVAHRGLAGAVTPLLGELDWIYDVVFLVLSLPAVVVIGARLYASLDPSADLVADRVTNGRGESGLHEDEPGEHAAQ